MFRKLTIALGTTAVLAAAALTPTTASAWGWGGHHGHHGHHGWNRGFAVGFYAPTYAVAPNCYVVRRIVATPYGPQPRRVTVCD